MLKPKVDLLWATPDPEFQIVRSSRVCYQSEDQTDSKWVINGLGKASDGQMELKYPVMKVELGKNDEKLLRKIMSNEHNACLRFASAAFRLTGITRAASAQLTRIAHFGILQKSDRYSPITSFFVPEEIDNNPKLAKEAEEIMSKSMDFYLKATEEEGIKKETARYMIPQCSATELHLCSNFQGWKHMLSIRLSKKVMKETRIVAIELAKQLYELAPIIFDSDLEKALELEKGLSK